MNIEVIIFLISLVLTCTFASVKDLIEFLKEDTFNA